MSTKGTTYKVFVGVYAFLLTVDFEKEKISDKEEFFEWLDSCDWIDMDDGTVVRVENILFIQEDRPTPQKDLPQPTGND